MEKVKKVVRLRPFFRGHLATGLTEQREFMNKLFRKLKLSNLEDWYKVKQKQLEENGGTAILSQYNSSLYAAVKNIYPEFQWDAHKFAYVPRRYWDVHENQKVYMRQLGEVIGIKSYEDWYKIDFVNLLYAKKGEVLLCRIYGGSPFRLLKGVFPEYDWKAWKLNQVPQHYFKDKNNLSEYIKYIEKELGIQQLDEWHNISLTQLLSFKGVKRILDIYGGIIPVLSQVYPEHNWEPSKYRYTINKTQSLLSKMLKDLFPDTLDIHFNYSHPEWVYKETNASMSFDVWIHSLNLAFEYNGELHYKQKEVFTGLERLCVRDIEKRQTCKLHGITLIDVPFWWDRSKESLKATIHKYRPELIPNSDSHNPIPLQNPNFDKRFAFN